MKPFNQPTKTTLHPLLPTWSDYFQYVTTTLRRRGVASKVVDGVRERREALFLRQERPFRVMNQRRRLFAAYWAMPCPSGYLVTRGLITSPLAARHGQSRPTWLGKTS